MNRIHIKDASISVDGERITLEEIARHIVKQKQDVTKPVEAHGTLATVALGSAAVLKLDKPVTRRFWGR